jgi:hypothetical protein
LAETFLDAVFPLIAFDDEPFATEILVPLLRSTPCVEAAFFVDALAGRVGFALETFSAASSARCLEAASSSCDIGT